MHQARRFFDLPGRQAGDRDGQLAALSRLHAHRSRDHPWPAGLARAARRRRRAGPHRAGTRRACLDPPAGTQSMAGQPAWAATRAPSLAGGGDDAAVAGPAGDGAGAGAAWRRFPAHLRRRPASAAQDDPLSRPRRHRGRRPGRRAAQGPAGSCPWCCRTIGADCRWSTTVAGSTRCRCPVRSW